MWGVPVPPESSTMKTEVGGLAVTTFTNFTQVMANPNGSKEGEIIKANWRGINGGD